MTKRAWAWSLAGYLILRWILLTQPGYFLDLSAYKRWAIHIACEGISQVYLKTDMDYPPLYAYLLAPIGRFYGWIAPEALQTMGDSTIFTILVKLPPLIFDLGVAWLLYRTGKRIKTGSWSAILPAAYLLSPAVLYNHGYGGQPDSVLCFFLLAALLALSRRLLPAAGARQTNGSPSRDRLPRWMDGAWPAWVLLALAGCMKPLAAPYLPLFLVLSLALFGWRSTLVGLGAAVLTVALVFTPFWTTGQTQAVVHRVVGDVGLMAYTSSNADNLWWIIGPWHNAEVPFLGPLTATQFGLGLFGIVYILLLVQAHRMFHRQSRRLESGQILALAAAVGSAFFILSTHMHENHMIAIVPLLAALLPAGRPWRWLFASVSFGIFINCMVHDPLVSQHWPWTLGGPTAIPNQPMHRPYFLFEIATIWFGTILNVATFGVFLYGILRGQGQGWIERMGR
jgi:dolichyl-phosphate-mannose-protein mannosyltransferase